MIQWGLYNLYLEVVGCTVGVYLVESASVVVCYRSAAHSEQARYFQVVRLVSAVPCLPDHDMRTCGTFGHPLAVHVVELAMVVVAN
jgi:hypothetical protein